MILDDSGHVLWFKPLDTRRVTDFRVQRYHGQPVLTWWRGRHPPHARNGYYVIYDSTYHKVADVHAGNGLVGDIHEFRITPRDTALITVYHRRRVDLSSVGGPKDGEIYDGIVQELDVASGRVLFDAQHLKRVATHAKTGFETAIPFRGATGYVEVQALARDGDVLGTSAPLRH
jgi:arylsulfotransferase ASST